MRYMYYECTEHGRLSSEGYKVVRKGIYKTVTCDICNQVAEQKFCIVCPNHGELKPSEIKVTKRSHGVCRICFRKTANQKRDNNREEFNDRQAKDKLINPDKWDKIYKRQYQNKRENQGDLLSLIKVCSARRITLEQYQAMIDAQDNKCGICKKEETCIDGRSKDKRIRRLSIDHCHRTGKVRGLLCHSCNTAIGKFKDDVELLHQAIAYITQHH